MRRELRGQKIGFGVLLLATLLVVIPVAAIVALVIAKGWGALSWEFLFSMPRDGMRAGGIFPAIIGTVYLVFISLAFALPIGVMAAIYLTEYAKDNLLTRIINLAIINLAGVSSVVFGLFGLSLFVVFLKFGVSIISGALTLGIMALPVIITTTREALRSVPDAYREVSFSLGASRWQTVRHAVLPRALSGILTGAILSVGRVAGETAPILFTVAAFYLPNLPTGLSDQAMALPYHLYVITTQIPGIPESFRYGTALVLIGIVLIMNVIATVVRSRASRKK
ncbi:MAG: phosphate ABC transporter permease PstA [Acidobacteriota bacterium]|jgi:phosphate ABC transporter, permease protein PstA|nr:phosphate ABC transporter permease PstA [Acidobacteriota bacterium]OQB58208.1 MAG: Phosphate transport system permease protein PstA [Candidatus Aminicenantes bacterium ADurb.Bin147]HNQ80237.1 phosphate ABC transporter permease PstA [Candidatus Aminicenantes bacterium]MDD8028935.1 phosphate ABC transporter permease PstA [Acidobacteriota bacterium]MDD8033871.1 phosphate ABC transporter permease PstA [Acidobacteriota bacterium]